MFHNTFVVEKNMNVVACLAYIAISALPKGNLVCKLLRCFWSEYYRNGSRKRRKAMQCQQCVCLKMDSEE